MLEFETTTETAETLIGKEIAFNGVRYNNAISFLRRKPLQNLQAVISAYNDLQILPPFDNGTLESLTADSGEGVCNQYLKLSEKDLSKVTNPVLRDNQLQQLQSALQPFKQAVSALLGGMHDLSNLGDFHRLDSFSIIKGQPVLNESVLREKYLQRIENEKQATVYALAQAAIEKLEDLRSALLGTAFDPARCEWVGNTQTHGIFENEADGSLTLNPYLLERL